MEEINGKNPFKLMDEAGYVLYQIDDESEIDKFKKYYSVGEGLRLYHSRGLSDRYVFFAVRKNVDEIRRENFKNPSLQDEYGTSVLCIQILKKTLKVLSIKSRYNKTVSDSDDAFSKNLDNIIPGLTDSFIKYFQNEYFTEYLKNNFLESKLHYILGKDGKYYRYNLNVNGVYYCENNIIIDKNGNVIDTYTKEKERYILIDNFIIDLKEKKIKCFDQDIEDAFIDSINDIGNIKRISVSKFDDDKILFIEYEDGRRVEILVDKHNSIIGYKNDYIEKIGNNFLSYNPNVIYVSLPSATTIGDSFLFTNNTLTSLSLPNVETIGDSFLCYNCVLTNLSLPKVETIGNDFLSDNETLTSLLIPNVTTIGDKFLYKNDTLTSLSLPKVTTIGNSFLFYSKLTSLSLPSLITVGDNFLYFNKFLASLSLPNVTTIGNSFLFHNRALTSLFLPSAVTIGDKFLYANETLTDLSFSDETLTDLSLSSISSIGKDFLPNNKYFITIHPSLGFTEMMVLRDCFIPLYFGEDCWIGLVNKEYLKRKEEMEKGNGSKGR